MYFKKCRDAEANELGPAENVRCDSARDEGYTGERV